MRNYYAKKPTKYGFKLVKADKSRVLFVLDYLDLKPQTGMRNPHKRRGRRKLKAQIQTMGERQ